MRRGPGIRPHARFGARSRGSSVSAARPSAATARALPALASSATPIAIALMALSLGAAPSRPQFFNAVYSRDAVDVMAVADSGALFRSVNGGVSWTRTQLGNKPLRDVVAWDWNIVVVGDSGKVWRSADLGGSWALGVVVGTPD